MTYDEESLRAELAGAEGPYAAVSVVESTGSTNADLRKAAEQGARDRTVLIAERQTGGVGRLGRRWESPPGGLYVSVLLRPDVPAERLGSLAIPAGLALAQAAGGASLKWPNDVLHDGRKLAGILAELIPGEPPAVVVGMGVNVASVADVPPGPGGLEATSLEQMGRHADPQQFAVDVLGAFAQYEATWRAAAGALDGLLDAYRQKCGTLGKRVDVELPDGTHVQGEAVDVDADGCLVVRREDGEQVHLMAGDVVHVR